MPEDNEDDLPKVGGNPLNKISTSLADEQRKKKQQELKAQMVNVQKAAEVFMAEVAKAEEIYGEMDDIKPIDFVALRKQFHL